MATHLEDETALVARAQLGDEDAFTKLYDQCSRKVYLLALKLTGDHHEAEDVLQDAFLKAFVHLGEFRKESRFSTWLTRIAANEALTRLRRRGQKRISLDGPVEMDGERSRPREFQDHQDDAELAYSKLELQMILSKVIGKLEPASRTILVLRYVQDVSTEATARLLGLSEAAVKTRLLRARLKMRKSLSDCVGARFAFGCRAEDRVEELQSSPEV
jgi:RNA polymerase sigma-70 factor (ECF subfamily)